MKLLKIQFNYFFNYFKKDKIMEKSNKYTGVKYFKFEELSYFDNSTNVILKVNFDDSRFYENIEVMCEDCFNYVPEFANIDEKIEWVLNKLAGFVFDWVYKECVANLKENWLAKYLADRLYEQWLVSVEEDNDDEEQPIHVLNYECDYAKKKDIIRQEVRKEDI